MNEFEYKDCAEKGKREEYHDDKCKCDEHRKDECVCIKLCVRKREFCEPRTKICCCSPKCRPVCPRPCECRCFCERDCKHKCEHNCNCC